MKQLREKLNKPRYFAQIIYASLFLHSAIAFAGPVISHFAGDEAAIPGEKRAVLLNGIDSLVADSEDKIYLGSSLTNLIYKLENNTITHFAGTGVRGTSGDCVPVNNNIDNCVAATQAKLYNPIIAVDGWDNIYVLEKFSQHLRIISSEGKISTLIDPNNFNFGTASSIVIDKTQTAQGKNSLYFADNHRIIKVILNKANEFPGVTLGNISVISGQAGQSGSGGDGNKAGLALLNSPHSLSLDNLGNLYFIDQLKVVRKISANAGNITSDSIISRVAGNGQEGNYVAGPVLNTPLHPISMVVRGENQFELLIGGLGQTKHLIKVANGNSQQIAGNQQGSQNFEEGALIGTLSLDTFAAIFRDPQDPTDLFFTTVESPAIIYQITTGGQLNANSTISLYAGKKNSGFSADGTARVNALLAGPRNLVIDKYGNLYYSDRYNNRVRKINRDGIISTYAGNGSFDPPQGAEGVQAVLSPMSYPAHLAFDENDNLYIHDAGNMIIRKVNSDGIITTFAGSGNNGNQLQENGPATATDLPLISSITVDAQDNLFILEASHNKLFKVDAASGQLSTLFSFNLEAGDFLSTMTFDKSSGYFFVILYSGKLLAINAQGQMQELPIDPNIPRLFGYKLQSANSLTANAQGVLFVSEFYKSRIWKIIPNFNGDSQMTLVAGSESVDNGYWGNGGDPLAAQMLTPSGLAIEANGCIFVSEEDHNVIRYVCDPAVAPVQYQEEAPADNGGNPANQDSDGDGSNDAQDNCPLLANANQADADADQLGNECDANDDNDFLADAQDNCPLVANDRQDDADQNGVGDVCENDDDGDGILNPQDNCPAVANQDQADNDGDGTGNSCENGGVAAGGNAAGGGGGNVAPPAGGGGVPPAGGGGGGCQMQPNSGSAAISTLLLAGLTIVLRRARRLSCCSISTSRNV